MHSSSGSVDLSAPDAAPAVSVVIPVYNEAESIAPLHREIVAALEKTGLRFEILLVDDGSRDASRSMMETIRRADGRVRVLGFAANRGQSAAMGAGFAACAGDWVVSLDGDGQNDPADIPALLGKLREGFDLVCGWRRQRRDRLVTRRFPSYLGNRLIARIAKTDLHDSGCTLRAYRRELARSLELRGEMHRYIPLIAARRGAKIAEIPVNHRQRRFDRSKYGLGRMFRLPVDLLLLSRPSLRSPRILRCTAGLSLVFIGAGLVLGTFRFGGIGNGPGGRLRLPVFLAAALLTLLGMLAGSVYLIATKYRWVLKRLPEETLADSPTEP